MPLTWTGIIALQTCESVIKTTLQAIDYSRFADRDLFMRFQGGGVGHKAIWDWNEIVLCDAGKSVDPWDDGNSTMDSDLTCEGRAEEDEVDDDELVAEEELQN